MRIWTPSLEYIVDYKADMISTSYESIYSESEQSFELRSTFK